MKLKGQIAVVTGASRGVGRGIALALGAEGAIVYVTGRTMAPGGNDLPGTILQTAQDVSQAGGQGIAVRCDHTDDSQVEALFQQVQEEQGKLDILVNNVFHVPSGPLFNTPFWEQPISFWDNMHDVGLRSHYVASVLAVPLMLSQNKGFIANISSFGGGSYQLNVAYGVGKAGVDRLARDMAHDLLPHNIASVSLWPGIVRTERIVTHADSLPFDTSNSESPQFTGRAIAALANDPKLLERTGKRLVVAELAQEYGFTDIDGSQPKSLRSKPKK